MVFADADTGFFCYNYVDGMDSNLYMTKDLGKTFSKVTLGPAGVRQHGGKCADSGK
ncbi:MAG: hypothetical protein ACLRWA_02485 [Lachnospira sp.]